MSGFDALWGDELTENDVAECMELETQASQVPVPSVNPVPSGSRRNNFLLEDSRVTNAPQSTGNALSHIPPFTTFKFKDDQAIRSMSTSSSSSSSSPALSLAQRKLKTPVRSLPDMSLSQSKEKIQAATTEWLRKELEKYKKQESELKLSKQTLEGEVCLLRGRDSANQQQLIKVREHCDQEIKRMEEKFLTQIKELKKEAENAKMQLVMKSKESEANKERYLELKNVSVLEPEFPRTQTPARDRCKILPKTPRSAIRCDNKEDDDNEEDYFSESVVTKRQRREAQSDLKTFSCDELIRVMDGPGVTSPVKRPRDKPVVEIDLTESPAQGSDSTTAKSVPERETVVRVRRVEVVESKTADLGSKFPWLKDKSFSLTVHLGQLLYKEISDKIYTLADPEIKIIVPPCIDFDPGNVLKMDCSDLKYLEDLEKGEKIWGVDLKTMYDTSKPTSEDPQVPEDDDLETLETVKTILGSQMCGQSPDQSRLSESFTEAHSPNNLSTSMSNLSKTADHEDSILLRNLEPIHVHLRALTKLASWDSAMDLISAIVHHLTLMINELHERLCDPRIPDQLKDQFYNNEFAVGKLFMKGPYQSNDLLTHQKWTERERYVELRRGLAVLSLLCSLNRDTANLVLDHKLLDDLLTSKSSTIPSSNRSYNQESFIATSLRKQCQRKITCKVDESTLRYTELLKEEDSKVKRQIDRLTDRISGSRLSIDSTPSTSTASDTASSVKRNIDTDISHNEVMSLLTSRKVDGDMKAAEDDENQSIGSNPSTVNPDEIMEIEDEIVERDIPSSVPRSLDEIDHDSFKAWYETYTQNKVNFTVEDSQTSGSKTHKYSKLLDPQLAENERKELSVYLKRRKFCKEFYKSVVDKGSVWEPTLDKKDEGGYTSDMESVRNLYDYENKISTMNSTITSDELASMRPGVFCPENKDSTIDTDITTRTQEESPEDNEWRVNSLQKNEEDPSLTKVEEPAKVSNEKNWSFFEKFKTNNAETSKGLSNVESLANFSGPETRFKQASSKTRKHSLAPLKKKGGRDASPTGSLTDINKEMEMEVEMLFGKTTDCKKFDKQKRHHQDINDMSPFAPELRFPEALSDDDQKSETLTEHLSRIPTMEDPEFLQQFKSLYNQAETISARLGLKLKPFKNLVTCAYLDKQRKISAEETKKKHEVSRKPRKSLSSDKEAGPSGGGSMRNQDESDPIITLLNEEALKYSLNKNIKSFEKKKGNLHLLDGIYEIVSAINYSRLTLVFYPLLSSCVSLTESLFKQSFNNEYFSSELFILIMKILNEVTCCQPPPDIIEKILAVLMYAVTLPDIVECLCKKRSNLVSLVTKTEFCFFKGVCMMQPLCYLVGALSSTSYPGYWTLCLAFTRWLRQLYDRYRIFLEPWYPPNQVCNCVPILHSALFTTLAKASAFLANHASHFDMEEGVRLTVESIVRDGIRLCEVLIDMDTGFVNHLDRFHLYNEFLATVKEMHYDPFFSPSFQLDSHQLKVVECLINANELLASKSKGAADKGRSEPPSLELTKLNFNRVFDPNHIFLKCSDKYDLLC